MWLANMCRLLHCLKQYSGDKVKYFYLFSSRVDYDIVFNVIFNFRHFKPKIHLAKTINVYAILTCQNIDKC